MNDLKGNRTIDIDDELLRKISNVYNNTYTIFSKQSITTEGYVTAVYNSYRSNIDRRAANISSLFTDIAKDIVDTLTRIGAIDDSIKADFDEMKYDFNDVIDLLGSLQSGTKITKADKSFFEKCSNAKITEYKDDKGNMQFKVSCDGYEYDSRTSSLATPNGGKITVKYYVPSNCSDVSSLNTLTALSGAGEISTEEYPDMKSVVTNSVVIIPSKPKGEENSSFYTIKDGVIASTVFANKVTGQKEECQNIIAGCSAGGCASLKIAAVSGDTYDTVMCINNAALVGGVNAKKGTKEQFDSLEDLKKLNGKNIYFISTKSDPNLCHHATSESGWAECNSVAKSYLYTGVELVTTNCPNSDVYLITNSDYSGFSNINNSNENYHYSSNYWNTVFGNKGYSSHAEYKNVLCDLINNGFVGYNIYFKN